MRPWQTTRMTSKAQPSTFWKPGTNGKGREKTLTRPCVRDFTTMVGISWQRNYACGSRDQNQDTNPHTPITPLGRHLESLQCTLWACRTATSFRTRLPSTVGTTAKTTLLLSWTCTSSNPSMGTSTTSTLSTDRAIFIFIWTLSMGTTCVSARSACIWRTRAFSDPFNGT